MTTLRTQYLAVSKAGEGAIVMSEFAALAQDVCSLSKPKILRFSECILPGARGYQWASAKTSSVTIMRYLCACWNHREEIAAWLRSRPHG